MKITGTQIGSIDPAYLGKIKKTAPATSTEAIRSADQVVLSEDVNAIEAARKQISETPDIRLEKVQTLQRQIEDGTYHVPAETIADKILTERRLSELGQK